MSSLIKSTSKPPAFTCFEWPRHAEAKMRELEDRGLKPAGVILVDEDTGQRATIDRWGRVQWWQVDDSGIMKPLPMAAEQNVCAEEVA